MNGMEICRMEFSGKLLNRGFWLYIWDIKEDEARHLYVGRTGDTSSANASSPFRRVGQHLDMSLHAKGNALGRRLKEAGINAANCTFELVAIGPIFKEQSTLSEHNPLRDKTAALERALADELKLRGYEVLGVHPRANRPDPELFKQVVAVVESSFPDRRSVAEDLGPLYLPVVTRNGGSASAILLRDRER